jgi:hypothetical protein
VVDHPVAPIAQDCIIDEIQEFAEELPSPSPAGERSLPQPANPRASNG